MKIRKKKQGNVLLIVVGFFAFASVLITSVLMMTTTGFKLRKDESTRIENFYGADSGIGIAEDATIKLIEEAIELGNVAAENQEGSWDDKNEVFRKEYSEHIRKNFKKKVDNVVGDGTTLSTAYDKFAKNGQPIKVKVDKFEDVFVTSDNGDQILDAFAVGLNSTFKDKDAKDRIVTVNYNLDIPDYGIESIEKPFESKASNLLDYVLATDGNLYIDNAIQQESDLDIYGDIWIGGHEVKNERFGRGIHVKGDYDNDIKTGVADLGSDRIDIHGKVATKGAITVENEKIKFHGDVFSRDFKVSGKKNLVDIKSVDEKAKGLYVYNDLIVEAEKTTLNLNDYYGLNDLSDKNFDSSNLTERQKSSSIIVNSEDFGNGSFIKADNMYISGTAYIGGIDPMDDLKNYQSGESIVINRNTKPYTDRDLISSMDEVDKASYLFKYKNPLHIVDRVYRENMYRELTVRDKVEIVENHYDGVNVGTLENNNHYNGVKVGNITATGVAYANNSVINSNPGGIKLGKEQKRFAEEVYLRNTRDAEMPLDFWNQPEDVSVSESINWNAIAKIIRKDVIQGELLKQGSTTEKEKRDVFTKHKVDTINDYVDSNLGVYKSKMNLETMLKGMMPGNSFVDIGSNNIVLLFNNTNKDIQVIHDMMMTSNDKIDIKVGYGNNLVDVKMNCSNNIVIVISKGDITLNLGVSGRGNLISLGAGDLTLKALASNTYGNFSTNQNALNNAFKEIFEFEEFENILGGGDGSGEGENGESNTVVYPSELIQDKVWNLEK